MGIKVMSGSTDNWPQFNDLKIDVMFNYDYMSSLIFVLHNNNTLYNLYDFTSLAKPNLTLTKPTNIRESFIFFLDDVRRNSTAMRTASTLNRHMQVITAITYKEVLIFISNDSFCVINMKQTLNEKEVKIKIHFN